MPTIKLGHASPYALRALSESTQRPRPCASIRAPPTPTPKTPTSSCDPVTNQCRNSSLNCSNGYFGNAANNMCVRPENCQAANGTQFYADNDTKMCVEACALPLYPDNSSYYCVSICPESVQQSGVECEDGNYDPYDGCDSCTKDPAFECEGLPSLCYYASSASVRHKLTMVETSICNTVTFEFSIGPYSEAFSRSSIEWQHFLTVTAAPFLTPSLEKNVSFVNDTLSLSFEMSQDIENLSLTFESDFGVLLPHMHTFNRTQSQPNTFVVQSSNQPALYTHFLNQTSSLC